MWPDRDSPLIPDDDYKSKVDPIWKNSGYFEESDDHNPKPEPLKAQNLRLRSTRDTKGVSSYKEFKFHNNYKRGDKDDQNHPRSVRHQSSVSQTHYDKPHKSSNDHPRSLRHQSSAPQTHYDKTHKSSSDVVFGAVQGNREKNEAVDIKPVDYGDPMYDHYNIRSRAGYGNLFDY